MKSLVRCAICLYEFLIFAFFLHWMSREVYECAEIVLKSLYTVTDNIESVIRDTDNLKNMVELTPRAMRLEMGVRSMDILKTDPASEIEEYWRDNSLPILQSTSSQSTKHWDEEVGEEEKPLQYQNVTFYHPQPMDRELDIQQWAAVSCCSMYHLTGQPLTATKH